MKKRYYLYGLLVLIILFIAYNYYSAYQAEGNINELIQTQVDKANEPISVQYTSIDVSPFLGNIQFEKIAVKKPETVRRANSLTLDLNYYDFLTFNFGGTKYGLKHLSEARLILLEPAYENTTTLTEVNFDTLFIQYSGNMWDAIQSYFTPVLPSQTHTVTIKGRNASYRKPQSSIGTFAVDSTYAHLTFTKKSNPNQSGQLNTVQLKDISWNPPDLFEKKYAFFIRGFGFKTDSIPFSNAGFSYHTNTNSVKIVDGRVEMKLFTATFYGSVETKTIARFSPLNITIASLSPQLKNVLRNMEQLLGISIPVGTSGIRFQLTGPVVDPRIAIDRVSS